MNSNSGKETEMKKTGTIWLSDDYCEEMNSPISITEPAAVELKQDGEMSDDCGLLTDPYCHRWDRGPWKTNISWD